MNQDSVNITESSSSSSVDVLAQFVGEYRQLNVRSLNSTIDTAFGAPSEPNHELSCHTAPSNSSHVAEHPEIGKPGSNANSTVNISKASNTAFVDVRGNSSNIVTGNVRCETSNPSVVNVRNPASNYSILNVGQGSSNLAVNMRSSQASNVAIDDFEFDDEDNVEDDADITEESDECAEQEGRGGAEDETSILDKQIEELEAGAFSLAEHKATDDCCGGGGCGCGCGVCKGRNVYQSCGFNTFLKIYIKQNCKLRRNEAKQRARAIYVCMCEAEREAYRRLGCCKRRIRVCPPCPAPCCGPCAPCAPCPCPPTPPPPCDLAEENTSDSGLELLDAPEGIVGNDDIELLEASENHETEEAN